MKIEAITLIGLGAVILSGLGQETNREAVKTNATEGVTAVLTESTNAADMKVNVEIERTNATELVGMKERAAANAVGLINPATSITISRRLEAPDVIVSGKTTLKGPLLVFFNKQNPLAVFNPFQPEMPGEKTERPLSDPHLGAPQGIVLFSIHR